MSWTQTLSGAWWLYVLSTRVYVLITSGRGYLCVTLLGPCSLLPLAGEQQKLCLCEGEALASALSQGLVMIVKWHGLQYMLYQIEDCQRVGEVEYRKSSREDAGFCTVCVEHFKVFAPVFLCVVGLAGTWLFAVVLVGAWATLPFSRGA